MKGLKEAIELGAVKYGDYKVKYQGSIQLIHRHYFNKEGTEVGYYSPTFDSFHVFTTPRVWDESFIKELTMHMIQQMATCINPYGSKGMDKGYNTVKGERYLIQYHGSEGGIDYVTVYNYEGEYLGIHDIKRYKVLDKYLII